MNALDSILKERVRQDMKWGVQTHAPEHWMCILCEEVGEAAKAVLEENHLDYYKEMTQIAAVALAALECFDHAPVFHTHFTPGRG